MRIEELAETIYEDLNGKILSVKHQERGLALVYECDHWRDPEKRVAFTLVCSEVAETDVRPHVSWELVWLKDHPLLWNHNEPLGDLYFWSPPENCHEVVGRLYEAHENALLGWRPLRDFVNCSRDPSLMLASGFGLLASGPLPLLSRYREAVGHLLRTRLVETRVPAGGWKLLLFDNHFVVCKAVEVEHRDAVSLVRRHSNWER